MDDTREVKTEDTTIEERRQDIIPQAMQYEISPDTLNLVTSLADYGFPIDKSIIDRVVRKWATNTKYLLELSK